MTTEGILSSSSEPIQSTLEDMLSSEDMGAIRGLLSEMKETMDNRIIWRSPEEARFIVSDDSKFPTSISKYRQAELEQLVMFENLVFASFDYREAKIDLDEVTHELNTISFPGDMMFERERLVVKRDRLLYKLYSLRRQAKDRVREIIMWQDIKESIKK